MAEEVSHVDDARARRAERPGVVAHPYGTGEPIPKTCAATFVRGIEGVYLSRVKSTYTP